MRTIKEPPRRLLARRGDDVLVEEHGFVYLLSAQRMTAFSVCNSGHFRDGNHAALVAQGWKFETPQGV